MLSPDIPGPRIEITRQTSHCKNDRKAKDESLCNQHPRLQPPDWDSFTDDHITELQTKMSLEAVCDRRFLSPSPTAVKDRL
jgi:hypothetical protein